MNSDVDDRYLGDGVYASYDGYHVTLDLRGQDDTTRIALEPAVLRMLVVYQRDAQEKMKNDIPSTVPDGGSGEDTL